MAPRRAREPQLAVVGALTRASHPALEHIDPGWTALFWAPRTVSVLVLGASAAAAAQLFVLALRAACLPCSRRCRAAGLSLLVYCSGLLAPPWGLLDAPERGTERGIYAALALYLGTRLL